LVLYVNTTSHRTWPWSSDSTDPKKQGMLKNKANVLSLLEVVRWLFSWGRRTLVVCSAGSDHGRVAFKHTV
jgi:hypothetical protein